jgi:hypothetical protein
MNRALWGEVSPALRAAYIKWNESSVNLYFYYDGKVSEEDIESADCIAAEFISSYPEYQLEVLTLRWDYPKKISNNGELVYLRRELNPEK